MRPAPAARELWQGRLGHRRFVLAMLLAVGFFSIFVALGTWQVQRLHWKVDLIRDVDARVHALPVAAPAPAQWPQVEAGHLRYLHVQLSGHYLRGKSTLVHGGSSQGYGYWVMTPFQTDRGFLVLVNRGFVPPKLAASASDGDAKAPAGPVTLTGLLRQSEPHGGFLRDNQPDRNQWYSRDVAAIAAARALPAAKTAPYFVDAEAVGSSPVYPVAGLTKIHFRNAHLGYAITWYLLALGTLLCAGIFIRYRKA